METLVGVTDFKGEILVVQGENPYTGSGYNLCAMIEKYEPEWLTKALGLAFYRDIIATVTADPENVPAPYVSLINGGDYTDYNGELIYWQGLIDPTANYIYYWYKRNDVTSTSILGEVVSDVENGSMAYSSQKMATAFNRSVKGAYDLQHYLKSLPDGTFPHYDKYRQLDCGFFHPINTFNI